MQDGAWLKLQPNTTSHAELISGVYVSEVSSAVWTNRQSGIKLTENSTTRTNPISLLQTLPN